MAILSNGQLDWRLTRDSAGYRTYHAKFLVEVNSSEGPFAALNCPGLPLPGTPWLIDSDSDLWVWCTPEASVSPRQTSEPNRFFEVELTFTNKPPGDGKQRCQDQQMEDPLLEPAKVSGGVSNYSEEATHNRFGIPITNSAWEQIRGPQVEFDAGRETIRIEQNVATPLQAYILPSQLKHKVNIAPIWGFGRRQVKLSSYTWERRFYGQCYVYYNRVLEFDTNPLTFDRDLLDEGTKALRGRWNKTTGNWDLQHIAGELPNPNNPTHFDRFLDRNGNPSSVILNGAGLPAFTPILLDGWFLCVEDANKGNLLTNKLKWIHTLQNPQAAIPAWDVATNYDSGAIVSVAANIYISQVANTGMNPFTNSGLPGQAVWFFINKPLADRGAYAQDQSYDVGDYVTSSVVEFPAGSIHVEKYDEANFLILGVPVLF